MAFDSLSDPSLVHPALLATFGIFTLSFLVGFTSHSSLLRPAALPIILSCVYLITSNSHLYMRDYWSGMLGGISCTYLLQYLDLCLLSQWDFTCNGPAKCTPSPVVSPDGRATNVDGTIVSDPSKSRGSFWPRLHFGLSSTFSYRHVNKPYESRNTPTFDEHRPGYVPCRANFLIKSAIIAGSCYLFVDLVSAAPPENNATRFGPGHVSIFGRIQDVTLQELTIRAFSTMTMWISSYCVLQCIYNAMSIVAVGSSLSPVKSWRPAFGSPLEAYTIRRFWGNFWHQNLRRRMGEPAAFITHQILQLSKGSILARYLKIGLTFFISGLIHAGADMAGGIPFHDQGTIRFFVTQAFGIIIEDSIEALYRFSYGKDCKRRRTPGWARAIGYVWTFAFLVWSTPAWFYPSAARTTADTRKMIPFSIIYWLTR
ncbi:putative toxin biosynthesis protein [Glonium stellatum]|uniref:Putative toxin biosynthesis protein n=1 Tax=Glonium stellatum TaxID=574774 RepID=A0A8E2FCV4_9PEZI|nr:putative toxin biosynthesis protein [Glonium stellatum]